MFSHLLLLRNLLCVKVRIFMYLGLGMSVSMGIFPVNFPGLWALYLIHLTHMPLLIYKFVLLILINSLRNYAITNNVETALSFSFEFSLFIIADVTQCILFRWNLFLNLVLISIRFTLIHIAVIMMGHITVDNEAHAFATDKIILFAFVSHQFL